MLRLAIVEDEAFYQKELMSFIEQFKKEKQLELEVVTYSDGDEFVTAYDAQFDILLLDIQMPLLNGMEAAEEVRKIDSKVAIIFITNMSQYAIKGYEVDALDFILKPLNYFAFSERLNKVIKKIEVNTTDAITVKIKNGFQRINCKDILFIESQGHDLVVTTTEGVIKSSGAIKDLSKELESTMFYRIHRSYVVNLAYVEGINKSNVIVDGEELPISRSKKKDLLNVLVDNWDIKRQERR